jgi:purine-binding chemotaxis protein CheW
MIRSVATFWVDGLLLGVEIEHVQEVLRDQDVTPVPLADGAIAGLLNLRGRLSAAVELRHRLDLPPRPPGEAAVHVVVRGDGEPVSLVVDREGEVVEVDDRSAEPVPETVSPTIRGFITEVHQLDGPLLLVLDADRAITLSANLREVTHAGPGH